MPRIRRRHKKRVGSFSIDEVSIADLMLICEISEPDFSRCQDEDLLRTLEDCEAFYELHQKSLNSIRIADRHHPDYGNDCLAHAPGSRCWCWWQLDSPEPRDSSKYPSQSDQLLNVGEMSKEEFQLVEEERKIQIADDRKANGQFHDMLFWRTRLWWKHTSTKPRDRDIFESDQLIKMDVLSDDEQKILKDPASELRQRSKNCKRTRFYYMNPQELDSLNLPNRYQELVKHGGS